MTSDWCTWWFEGLWGHCCYEHDKAFAAGRFLSANWDLLQCVWSFDWFMAILMLLGTSTFGWPFYLSGLTVDPVVFGGAFAALCVLIILTIVGVGVSRTITRRRN